MASCWLHSERDCAQSWHECQHVQDVLDFVANVKCLMGLFSTWGTFGGGFNDELALGGQSPVGAVRASITENVRPFVEEITLNKQVQIKDCLA